MGHLRRSLAIARALVCNQDDTALVVTGSPAFGCLRLPPGVDLLKLPSMSVDRSRWTGTELRPPAQLAIPAGELHDLRSQLALASVTELRPDLAVVDCSPLGKAAELRAALQRLKAGGGCTLALGLRDVDDHPERLRPKWDEELLTEVADLYDLALVYGPSVADDARIERLRAAGVPVRHTGLVGAATVASAPEDLGEGYLLAMAGGGIDGFTLLHTVLDALRTRPVAVPAVLVAGPLMSTQELAALRERAAGMEVRVEQSRTDIELVLAGARAVVSMAGYSTVAEVLGSGKPALLVPRAVPFGEQVIRARRLAAAGRVELLEPAALEADAMADAIERLLARAPSAGEPLTGAIDAAGILLQWQLHRSAGDERARSPSSA